MNLKVSAIKSRLLRRAAIVGSYPFMALGCVIACAWNFLVDAVAWQIGLARTACNEWRK